MSVIDHLPQMMSVGQDMLSANSEQEMCEKQLRQNFAKSFVLCLASA